MADRLHNTSLRANLRGAIKDKLATIATQEWLPLGGGEMRDRVVAVVGKALDVVGQWEESHGRAPDVDFVNRKIRDVVDQKFGVDSATSSQLTRNAQDLFVEVARDVTGVTGSLER